MEADAKRGCALVLLLLATNWVMSAVYGVITLALWNEYAPADLPRIGFWTAWGAWILFSAATSPFRNAAMAAEKAGDKVKG